MQLDVGAQSGEQQFAQLGFVQRAVRVRLALLMVYLAIPIDLIPDFIPVLGYADDAIIVAAVLRGVVCRAGLEPVRQRWPGTDDGFAALCRLTGLPNPAPAPSTTQSATPNDSSTEG